MKDKSRPTDPYADTIWGEEMSREASSSPKPPPSPGVGLVVEILAMGMILGGMAAVTYMYVMEGEPDWLYPWMIGSWVVGAFAMGRVTKT